jgi:hypothetical protein
MLSSCNYFFSNMNYSSVGGSSIHATVNLIMAAKPLDTIVGQPTTKSMDRMTKQMVQMFTPVKTTAWGRTPWLIGIGSQ